MTTDDPVAPIPVLQTQAPTNVVEPDAELLAERSAEEKAAFLRANQINPDKKKDNEDDQKAGFYIAEQSKAGFHIGNHEAAADDKQSSAPGAHGGKDIDLRGQGWIKCGDGTWIKDKGGSIYIKGHPPSGAQIQMCMQLAQERGWGKVAAWKANGRGINEETTRMLQMNGIACCASKKEAGGNAKAGFEAGLESWGLREAERLHAAGEAVGKIKQPFMTRKLNIE